MMLQFDCFRPTRPGEKDLKWAIGETGRTSFVWTIAPPGTEFGNSYGPVEDYYLSIFKWTDPLWSALDIRIDEDFIIFLEDSHSRKEYNQEFLGEDFDYLKAPHISDDDERPLPLGNHVISICMGAGILCEKPRRHFSLGAGFLRKPMVQQIDEAVEALQKYLDTVQVSRAEIENHPRYLEKRAQHDRFWEKEENRDIERAWRLADISKMKDIPQNQILLDMIKKKVRSYISVAGGPANQEEAGDLVRYAWGEVRSKILAAQKNGGSK